MLEKISAQTQESRDDVTIKITQLGPKVTAQVVNGSINATGLSDNSEISAVNGSINTVFGLKANKNGFSGRNLSGEIGSGGSKINLESVNDSIKVLKVNSCSGQYAGH